MINFFLIGFNMNIENENSIQRAVEKFEIESLAWTPWTKMPKPENCRFIRGPKGPGLYQIKNVETNQFIQFGIGLRCEERMQSLYPVPYGTSGRDNLSKRNYILNNYIHLEYRTVATTTKLAARCLENHLKSLKIHLFNT